MSFRFNLRKGINLEYITDRANKYPEESYVLDAYTVMANNYSNLEQLHALAGQYMHTIYVIKLREILHYVKPEDLDDKWFTRILNEKLYILNRDYEQESYEDWLCPLPCGSNEYMDSWIDWDYQQQFPLKWDLPPQKKGGKQKEKNGGKQKEEKQQKDEKRKKQKEQNEQNERKKRRQKQKKQERGDKVQ
jgi:hypothetical protein